MPDPVFRRRLLITVILFGIAGIAIVIQYAAVMLGSPSGNTDSLSNIAVERGAILDRNGRLLAIQTEVFTLVAGGPQLRDHYASAQELSPLIGIDTESLYRQLTEAGTSTIIKRGLDITVAEKIRALIKDGKLPGIYLEEAVSRSYPEGEAAAHIIGFTGLDNEGLEGIEYVFEQRLANRTTVLPDGRAYGDQIFLTLDMQIQHAMERLADKAIADHEPEALIFLVADAPTGEILAYTIRPSFDPNRFRESTQEQRRNLPIGLVYEPGSVFKIFSLASVIQSGGIDSNTMFRTSGGYRNRLFRDPITDLADYGTINTEGIIKYSSNVGAAFASDAIEQDQFFSMLKTWGFGERTGIELSGEERGLLKPMEEWSARTKPTIAIGQEIGVTAMQMLSAATALANEGVLLKPHVVKRIVSPAGAIVQEFTREPVRRVLDPAVAQQMLTYMNAATDSSGTGRRASIKGIDISVKTGTAQMIDPDLKQYSDNDFVSSSIAVFPTNEPRLIVYIVLFKPKGEFYGGRIAAPIIAEAAEFLVPYIGIDRTGDQTVVQDQQVRITVPVLPSFTTVIPDFTGLPLRTLLPLYLRSDLIVEIEGEGMVVSQSPPPGTPVEPGLQLKLVLRGRE